MTTDRSQVSRSAARIVKKLLSRLKRPRATAGKTGGEDTALEDSGYFSSLFTDQELDTQPLVRWRDRQAAIQATPFDRHRGQALFAERWAADPMAAGLPPASMARLAQFLDFVQVPADTEVIGQDEQGNYMLLVLDGLVAIDRQQPWGGMTRLAEARPGDLLGEMSFLDAGVRFSACRTLQPTTLAVLDAGRLDDLLRDEPQLASAFLASLARRLSLRMRHVSTCLSALLWQA
jgi:CRP/FNR family transcriptional regulator, cyclic AMP receptor protein